MSKKSTAFTLKAIDTEKIEALYSITIPSNISKQPVNPPVSNITKISELQVTLEPDAVSFLDEAKKQRKCIPTMIHHCKKNILPETTGIHCFWCRHSFDSMPIGCPVKYVPSQVEKKYVSEITKDTYQIKENFDDRKVDELVSEMMDLTTEEKDYYETDGVFCSFNCCLSWIDSNKKVPLYANSRSLLMKLYIDIFDHSPKTLTAAPDWRILTVYGGHLSITDYRKTFNKIIYTPHNKILPKFVPLGFLFEEKSKF